MSDELINAKGNLKNIMETANSKQATGDVACLIVIANALVAQAETLTRIADLLDSIVGMDNGDYNYLRTHETEW